jgi:hypothetical protein
MAIITATILLRVHQGGLQLLLVLPAALRHVHQAVRLFRPDHPINRHQTVNPASRYRTDNPVRRLQTRLSGEVAAVVVAMMEVTAEAAVAGAAAVSAEAAAVAVAAAAEVEDDKN